MTDFDSLQEVLALVQSTNFLHERILEDFGSSKEVAAREGAVLLRSELLKLRQALGALVLD
jgi:hypothetical protein